MDPGHEHLAAATAYATERGSTANTLNFIVPAHEFFGNLRLTVILRSNAGTELDRENLHIDATLRQTLRIRAILVSYNGPSTSVMPPAGQPPPPNIQLAAPALADLQATAARALTTMPVQSTGSFRSAGTLAWTQPLDDPRTGAGGCSNNWNALLTALTNQRTNDGNRTDVVYYGLLPAAIPLNVPGCGFAGLGAAAAGDQQTLVHEIGHGYGFQHTPCGNAGATDPSYPTYEPYPSASIGEYGLDINNGSVFSPQSTLDYMSYCFPGWMSLYQHRRLIGHARLDPRWERDEPWWKDYLRWKDFFIPRWWLPDPPPDEPWRWVEMTPHPVISLTGVVRSWKEVDVATVARVEAAGEPSGVQTRLTAMLIDAAGRAIARGPVVRLSTRGECGCGSAEGGAPDTPPFAFQAFVPDAERGSALTIVDGDEEIWRRHAPERPPRVERLEAQAADDAHIRLRWQATASVERPEAWVQWSENRGKHWHALATGLFGGEATLPLVGLAAGEVLVRVLVHDGFSTTASDPVPLRLPRRPPQAAILQPEEGQTLLAGRTLHLMGSATDAAGTPLADDACQWLLDGREVGRGREIWLEAPSPGEHRATLVVRAEGAEVERQARFRTVDAARLRPVE